MPSVKPPERVEVVTAEECGRTLLITLISEEMLEIFLVLSCSHTPASTKERLVN